MYSAPNDFFQELPFDVSDNEDSPAHSRRLKSKLIPIICLFLLAVSVSAIALVAKGILNLHTIKMIHYQPLSRLFDGSTKFFYGNSCNSGTESRKMVFKVGN